MGRGRKEGSDRRVGLRWWDDNATWLITKRYSWWVSGIWFLLFWQYYFRIHAFLCKFTLPHLPPPPSIPSHPSVFVLTDGSVCLKWWNLKMLAMGGLTNKWGKSLSLCQSVLTSFETWHHWFQARTSIWREETICPQIKLNKNNLVELSRWLYHLSLNKTEII